MTPDEVKALCEKGYYNDRPLNAELIETHISWILLSENHAFKIKKPVKFSFLDFSSTTQREIYCREEVVLNSRFSDIYLGAEPIFFKDEKWTVGGEGMVPIDYAVVMRKMDERKRMDSMMKSGKVDDRAVTDLAKIIARFHLKAERIDKPFDLTKAKTIFNDILTVADRLDEEYGGDELKRILNRAVLVSDEFLEKNQNNFQRRIEQGFKRDLHGDLHCENIFLEDPPVIFDCIEYNEEYRQIDNLYDIAFLSMDLESWGRRDLSQLLETTYKKYLRFIPSPEDDRIYVYFKCLRANIRAKIYALRMDQAKNDEAKVLCFEAFERYFSLFKQYAAFIEI